VGKCDVALAVDGGLILRDHPLWDILVSEFSPRSHQKLTCSSIFYEQVDHDRYTLTLFLAINLDRFRNKGHLHFNLHERAALLIGILRFVADGLFCVRFGFQLSCPRKLHVKAYTNT
jgi:hypothetical protein